MRAAGWSPITANVYEFFTANDVKTNLQQQQNVTSVRWKRMYDYLHVNDLHGRKVHISKGDVYFENFTHKYLLRSTGFRHHPVPRRFLLPSAAKFQRLFL